MQQEGEVTKGKDTHLYKVLVIGDYAVGKKAFSL